METFSDETKVRSLYENLLQSWNKQNAKDYSDLFTGNANVIGFDGSQMKGSAEIYTEIKRIFESHKVASYVSIIREVRGLGSTVFLLHAIAGMIPPGKSEINPQVNSVQTLIAQKQAEEFKITLFQNTPAAFHERPELREEMTKELQQVLKNNLQHVA